MCMSGELKITDVQTPDLESESIVLAGVLALLLLKASLDIFTQN